jgi:FKBP-type peptidyl-prolyl cis-trans isomerase FkpA
MTEITRVPLQPIARGSLGKLWLGVAAALLAAGGVAWAAMPAQVDIDTITAGHGPSPSLADVAVINYKGTLPDGKVFDQANAAVFPMQGLIPGFTKALQQMQAGGHYKAHIPASLAYGDKAQGVIPANTALDFDIEVLAFMTREQYVQQMQMMQQMQQQQQQQGAGPHGGPPGGAMPEGMVPPEGAMPPEGAPPPQ